MQSRDIKRSVVAAALAISFMVLVGGTAAAQPADRPPATPAEMVDTYNALADAILAVKKTEASLVRSILGAGYAHARIELGRAHRAIASGDTKASRAALERLARIVSQLGTEGDSAVAAIRKRLVEGGHHHHAAGEAEGMYEPGFVVVTRAAKQVFVDASRAIGRMAGAPNDAALQTEWKKVESAWAGLMKDRS
jgi:hypothetical protein